MSNLRLAVVSVGLGLLILPAALLPQRLCAQTVDRQSLQFEVSDPIERLEMIVNTSRILTTEQSIPKLLVENENIIRAQPIAPDQVQLSALQTGFTTLTLWDEDENEHAIDVMVYGDARELENVLLNQFPDATLRVRPLASSVIVAGYVPRTEMVTQITEIAKDYYPKVINNLTVGGVQQVLLHVKVMEVSRTKLRKMGFDWALFTDNAAVVQNAAGLIADHTIGPGMNQVTSSGGETLAFAVHDDNTTFFGFLEALRQYDLVKVLAEPNLVCESGRAASFNVGGEFPILIPQALGTMSVEYRQFGTRIDFVPIVLGNGRIHLEVRPQVSEIDPTRSVTINNTTVPGLRTRWADTAVEMNAGQTLALAGLLQRQIEAQNKGLPWLSDLPWIGAAFRRVEEQANDVELLIMVTPEFVSALDPHEVPPCGPGQLTTSPHDVDLYWRGYLEVPKAAPPGHAPGVAPAGLPPAGLLPTGSAHAEMESVEDSASRDQPASTAGSAEGHPRRRVTDENPSSSRPGLIGPSGYDDVH